MRSAFDVSLALAAVTTLGESLEPGKVELAPAAIAGSVGLVLGLVLGGLRSVVSRQPGPVRTAFWCLAGAALGLWPSLAIGAVPKLRGAHSAMALGSLAGGVFGGASVGAYLS